LEDGKTEAFASVFLFMFFISALRYRQAARRSSPQSSQGFQARFHADSWRSGARSAWVCRYVIFL